MPPGHKFPSIVLIPAHKPQGGRKTVRRMDYRKTPLLFWKACKASPATTEKGSATISPTPASCWPLLHRDGHENKMIKHGISSQASSRNVRHQAQSSRASQLSFTDTLGSYQHTSPFALSLYNLSLELPWIIQKTASSPKSLIFIWLLRVFRHPFPF